MYPFQTMFCKRKCFEEWRRKAERVYGGTNIVNETGQR